MLSRRSFALSAIGAAAVLTGCGDTRSEYESQVLKAAKAYWGPYGYSEFRIASSQEGGVFGYEYYGTSAFAINMKYKDGRLCMVRAWKEAGGSIQFDARPIEVNPVNRYELSQ